jgi:hypothetical protein
MPKFFCIILLLFTINIFGQKEYFAQRISEPITIDGILNEPAWSGVGAKNFVQYEPNTGDNPTYDTKAFVRYDDDALYVGITMYDEEPNKILKELANRDKTSNAATIGFGLDTYKDGINAFMFVVTSAGVQRDGKFSSEGEDTSWDAVWESEITIDKNGWNAEFRIPYNAIRFSNQKEQIWGFQIIREIRRLREQSFWNPANPNTEGFVNQFGVLKGINNIEPPFRLSVTPYLSAYYNTSHIPNVSGSFESGTAYSAGLDLKIGLSDAFTLDMTLIPDFGQTLSDQQVLNLSPFEVFFEENRQFFTEGLELFNKGKLFYTRRVGGRPINYHNAQNQLGVDETLISNPDVTSLINATKISGRTSKGTGIGFFNGVTAKEYAIIQNIDGSKRSLETSPLTNYNVMVVDQTLKNNSYVTFMNTNVWRLGDEIDANSTGIYTAFNDKNQTYGVKLNAEMSNRFTSDNNDFGFTYNTEIGKISGLWTYSLSHGLESDNYNPNDLGFLFSPNKKYFSANVAYNEYTPKNKELNLFRYTAGLNHRSLYKPNQFTDFNAFFNNFWLFKSRDAFGYTVNVNPVSSRDYFEPRTFDFSRYLPKPETYGINAFFSSDYRKVFAIDLGFDTEFYNQKGRNELGIRVAPRIRFNDKVSLFFNTNIDWFNDNQGYVNRIRDNIDIINENPSHILIGQRYRQVANNEVTLKYIFTNKMGVNMRLRHYWDKVIYNGFLTLDENSNLRNISFNGLDENGQPYYDNNVNIFNIDLQYQWRFAPGSDLFIVWKNNIFSSNDTKENRYFGNLSSLWDNIQSNSISVRAVYYLDYQSVF